MKINDGDREWASAPRRPSGRRLMESHREAGEWIRHWLRVAAGEVPGEECNRSFREIHAKAVEKFGLPVKYHACMDWASDVMPDQWKKAFGRR